MRNALLRLSLLLCAVALLPGCAWFLIAGVAGAATLAQPAAETQSAPVVFLNAPARMTTNPAQVAYSLADAEGDACSVSVEYAVGTGAFHPATPGTGGDGVSGLLPGSHVFSWNYSSDAEITLPETNDVRLRITAVDSTGKAASGESSGHSVGNRPPSVLTITLPSDSVEGTATILYEIADTHSDTARIEVEFARTSGDTAWYPASEDPPGTTASTRNLSTAPSPGVPHIFPWDSAAMGDLQGQDADVRIHIRASDDGGATWGAWLASTTNLQIRNNNPPRIVTAPVSPNQGGLIRIPYTLYDAEGHQVSILAEFRGLEDMFWRRATAGPGTTERRTMAAPTGTKGVFVWDSWRDGVAGRDVTVRLTPSEAGRVGLAGAVNLSVLNDGTDTHFSRTRMPTARRELAAASFGSLVVTFGGYVMAGDLAAVEAFDSPSDTWATRNPLSAAQSGLVCARIGDRVYAAGGTLTSVQVYDAEFDSWSVGPDCPPIGTMASAVAVGGKMVVIGRWTGSAYDGVDVFDPAAGFTTGAAMPAGRGRFGMACAAVNGRIYCMGGHTGSAAVAFADVYDPVLDAWSSALQAMPTTRVYAAAEAVGDRVFVLGGDPHVSPWITAAVESYDPVSGTWSIHTSMPSGVSSAGSVCEGGKILRLGGWTGSGFTATVVEYTPPVGQWSAQAALPTARWGPAGAAVGGKMVVLGGVGSSATSAAVEAFDPVTSTWTTRAPMPSARNLPGVAALDGALYAAGGENSLLFPSVRAECWTYNPASNTWNDPATSALANLPTARKALALVAFGGRLWAIGGEDAFSSATGVVEAYDPVTDTWNDSMSEMLMSMPTARSGFACVEVGGKIYAFGGFSSGSLASAEAYDPLKNEWTTLASMPTARAYPGAAVAGGRICVLGGWDGNLEDTAEVYDPGSDTWGKLPALPTGRGQFACASIGPKVVTAGGWRNTTGDNTVEVLELSVVPMLCDLGSAPDALEGACLVPLPGGVLLAGGANASGATATASLHRLETDVPMDENAAFTLDDAWVSVASLSEARSNAGAAEYGGKAYVVGGFDASGAALASLEEYDPATDSWTTLTPMPTARGALGVVRVGTLLHAIGGETGAGPATTAHEVYDFATATWGTASTWPGMGASRFGCGVVGGRIYAIGGDMQGPTALVRYYDPRSDTWGNGANLPRPIRNGLCVAEGGRLLLFGGEGNQGETSGEILAYDPARDSWRVVGLTLPYCARGMFGGTTIHSFRHRVDAPMAANQKDEFCLIGGGHDGTAFRSGFLRFYAR